MNERQKFGASAVLLYISLFAAMFALYFVGDNGEPFSLALLYAMLTAGLHPVVSPLLYLFSGFSGFSIAVLPVYAGQAVLLGGVFFLCRKLR